jgi:hypothetical protein
MNKLVEVAKTFLHVRESAKNNIAPEIQEMQKSTWLAPGAWPWCAAFLCHVLKLALQDPSYHAYIMSRYHDAEDAEKWRCKDASAFGWIKWAKNLEPKHGDLIVFDEKKTAKAGDIVVYDFSHIGIVAIEQIGNKIDAIEGNTAPKTTQRDGVNDGVYAMTRSKTLVKNYIRL